MRLPTVVLWVTQPLHHQKFLPKPSTDAETVSATSPHGDGPVIRD